MLNVLCHKTLEQARMEVLEERELEIMKSQQKEYEETMNEELIESQRYEAAEYRCKEETERRLVQNKARRSEKRSAHQKVNARLLSKLYLQGLREECLSELSSMGVLVAPKCRAMDNEVVPWLMDRICDFLREDAATLDGSTAIVNDGINDAQTEHTNTIKARYAKVKKDADDKIEGQRQTQIRKQQRREAREKRAKDQELEKYRDTIERNIIFKGEV